MIRKRRLRDASIGRLNPLPYLEDEMKRVLDKNIIQRINKNGFKEEMFDEYVMPQHILMRGDFSIEDFKVIDKFLQHKEDELSYKLLSNNEAEVNGIYVATSIHKSKKKIEVTVGEEKFVIDKELLGNVLGLNMDMNRLNTLVSIYKEKDFLKRISNFRGGSHLLLRIDTRESVRDAKIDCVLLNTKSNSTYTVQYSRDRYLIDCNAYNFGLEQGNIYFVFKDGNYIASPTEEGIFEYFGGDGSKIAKLGMIGKVYDNIFQLEPTVEELSYIFAIPSKDAKILIENRFEIDLFRVHMNIAKVSGNNSYLNYKFSNLDRKDLFLKILKPKDS